jgi:hypothetical protein
VTTPYTVETRAAWVPDDAEHHPLNVALLHVSVLELDRLVRAAADGVVYMVEPLEDLLPRPGWEVATQGGDDPSRYTVRQLDEDFVHSGSRRKLLLLLELAARTSLAPFDEKDATLEWVQRLRLAHPRLLDALQGESLFEHTRE